MNDVLTWIATDPTAPALAEELASLLRQFDCVSTDQATDSVADAS